MPIYLPEILPVFAPDEYKLHFAQHNGTEEPLDVFARSREEWQDWQEYRPERDEFNRCFVFSLARFYREPGAWLFGGIYRIVERYPDRYVVELTRQAEGFVGRLILRYSHSLPIRPNFETYYRGFEVLEILREPYSG